MAGIKKSAAKFNFTSVVLLVLLAIVMRPPQFAQSQENDCPKALGNLNICAPFIVPGTTEPSPSPACCNALQAVPHDCVCNTMRIASRLPSRCNLPPVDCTAN